MCDSLSCYLPPCGGGRRCEASTGGGYRGGGLWVGLPLSPTLPRKGGGRRKECALKNVRGSLWGSRRGLGQRLLHRGIGQPFTIDGDGVALLGDVAALLKELLRVVADVSRETLGAAGPGQLFQGIAQHRADALPHDARMHIEHLDMVRSPERGKA